MQICPVCYWEDTPHDGYEDTWWVGSNGATLLVAQRHFREFGAVTSDFVEDVRAPRSNEARAEDWRWLDDVITEKRDCVIAMIRQAFVKVSRPSEATTLHEAEALDEYAGIEARRLASTKDTDSHWWEIPDAFIERFSSSLCHMNNVGWRYHLPAYMSWTLKNYKTSGSMSVDSTIYTLLPEETFWLWPSPFELLSPPQKHAAASFLHFMSEYTEGMADECKAAKALDKYWSVYLDKPPD